jgi:hypothetical protein
MCQILPVKQTKAIIALSLLIYPRSAILLTLCMGPNEFNRVLVES